MSWCCSNQHFTNLPTWIQFIQFHIFNREIMDWNHVFADVTVILKTKRWVCFKKADDNLRHLVTHIVPPGSQEHLGVKLLKVSFWPRKKASMTTFGQIRCQTTRDSCLSCCFSQRTIWSLAFLWFTVRILNPRIQDPQSWKFKDAYF